MLQLLSDFVSPPCIFSFHWTAVQSKTMTPSRLVVLSDTDYYRQIITPIIDCASKSLCVCLCVVSLMKTNTLYNYILCGVQIGQLTFCALLTPGHTRGEGMCCQLLFRSIYLFVGSRL